MLNCLELQLKLLLARSLYLLIFIGLELVLVYIIGDV